MLYMVSKPGCDTNWRGVIHYCYLLFIVSHGHVIVMCYRGYLESSSFSVDKIQL